MNAEIKYKDARIIGLRSLSNTHRVNRVNYIVDSVFENPKESKNTLRSRFERIIHLDAAHLTKELNRDITDTEYISAAQPSEEMTDGKEHHETVSSH